MNRKKDKVELSSKKDKAIEPAKVNSKVGGRQPVVAIKKLASLRMIAKYIWPHKVLLFGGIFALVLTTLCTLIIYRSLEWIIDDGFAASSLEAISPYFLAIFGIIGLLAISSFIRFLCIALLGERVVADIREAVHRHLLSLSPSFFETNRPSEIASRLTADTTLIQTVVSTVIPIALASSFQAIGALVMVILISPILVLAILGVAVLIMIPVIYLGRRVRRLSRASQDRVAGVGTMANEAYGAIQIVQAFTREPEEISRFSETVEKVYAVAKKRILTRAWLVVITITLVYGLLNYGLWVGAEAVFLERITAGQLAALLGLGALAATSLTSLSEVVTILQRAAGAASRLSELLSTKSDLLIADAPSTISLPIKQAIQFDDVSFAYPSKPDIKALKNFSMDIATGETVAIVGASGAGKSTILQLLLRFFDPQEGAVKFNGRDIREFEPQELRRMFAFVPQETVIFANTIEENIRFGRPDASDSEVKAAVNAASCADFIEALPEGMKTYLGERGVRLSGGQRQRIAIARAILRDAPILLLDEATSSLDSESESKVQDAIEALMENRTTLVIAHRLSTVRNADKIIVLDDGLIVASGKHEDLVASGGLYARLAKLQFADVAPEHAVNE